MIHRITQEKRSLVHRYYDPSTGQFLSVDPLVKQTGQPYQYAGSDPANSRDPSGQWSCLGPNQSGPCPPGYTPGPPYNMITPQPPGSQVIKLRTGNYGLWLADDSRATITPGGVWLTDTSQIVGAGRPPRPNAPRTSVFDAFGKTAQVLGGATSGAIVCGLAGSVVGPEGTIVGMGIGWLAGGLGTYWSQPSNSEEVPPSPTDENDPNFFDPNANLQPLGAPITDMRDEAGITIRRLKGESGTDLEHTRWLLTEFRLALLSLMIRSEFLSKEVTTLFVWN